MTAAGGSDLLLVGLAGLFDSGSAAVPVGRRELSALALATGRLLKAPPSLVADAARGALLLAPPTSGTSQGSHFPEGLALKSLLSPFPGLTGVATAVSLCEAQWNGRGLPAIPGAATPLAAQILCGARHIARALALTRGERRADAALASDLVASCRDEELSTEVAHAAAAAARESSAVPVSEDDLARRLPELSALSTPPELLLAPLVASVDATRRFDRGHGRRSALLAKRLAAALSLPLAVQNTVELAALAHDIGVAGLSEELADREGPRAPLLAQHPIRGAALLERIPALRSLAPIVRMHHERADGSGYPARLRGDSITLEAKVVGIADEIEGMSRERTTREGFTAADIERQLRREVGAFGEQIIGAAIRQVEVQIMEPAR